MRVARVIRKGMRVVTNYPSVHSPFDCDLPLSYIELHDRKKRVAKRKANKVKYKAYNINWMREEE